MDIYCHISNNKTICFPMGIQPTIFYTQSKGPVNNCIKSPAKIENAGGQIWMNEHYSDKQTA